MKGEFIIVLILGLLFVASSGMFLGGAHLLTILVPSDFTPEKYCAIDSSRYFISIPDGVLVSIPDWGSNSNNLAVSTFEGKEFTAATLMSALKSHISSWCVPSDSDYCVNQKARAGTFNPVAISSSVFVRDDGVFFDNYKVLKSDQSFKVITNIMHSDIASSSGAELLYNRKYFGRLYGTTDAYNFKCAIDYGYPPVATVTSTTTLPVSARPTTTVTLPFSCPREWFDENTGICRQPTVGFDLISSILEFVSKAWSQLLGLFGR